MPLIPLGDTIRLRWVNGALAKFDAAMGRLFADKQITAVSYGRAGAARQRIARVLCDAA